MFFLLINKNGAVAKLWLIGCSLFFYTCWNPYYLILFLSSIIINYICSIFILDNSTRHRRIILYTGITFNILLIGYYKYTDFLLNTATQLLSIDPIRLDIILPLAISFFTFQQIAYLQDCYKGEIKQSNFIDYILFISFFPQLIAGPIVQFKEIVPQFYVKQFKSHVWENILAGLVLLSFGLFKKVIIADFFSIWANMGFEAVQSLNFISAWITSLSYTFQLYFDFSGYTDMALGAAMMFGIKLPQNFNSPYKATSIQDFWRRWHITLGRFLKNYLYIPLGGNRKGKIRTCFNLLLVFFIAGIWHGAGWTFILWGICHGLALVVHRLWSNLNIKLNNTLNCCITFLFVNFAWILFRSNDLHDFNVIISKMIHPNLSLSKYYVLPIMSILVGFTICLFAKNSNEYVDEKIYEKPLYIAIASITTFTALATIIIWNANEFLYFQF
nr:MBOAT family O-acyltransferase [Maridesulfovibrio salexigens]